MNKSQQILSSIVTFNKYSKYVQGENRRETWEEVIGRYQQMHMEMYPKETDRIHDIISKYVLPKQVLPSMRALQFAGKPSKLNNSRLYNCSFMNLDDYRCFSEAMFLLLSGCGVGYSVQKRHVGRIGNLCKPGRPRKFVVGDSIEGWADAVKSLIKAYFFGTSLPRFVFDDIREKGARLVTSGGLAPGPQPLKDCLHNIKKVLDGALVGNSLSPIDAHDMMCHIADAVLSGGIRRAAMICLFDMDDNSMLTAKCGDWWELNPQRGRANNSAIVLRSKCTEEMYYDLWDKIKASGSGDPGIYWTNDLNQGTNPCVEISLNSMQFCNLTTMNAVGDDLYGKTQAAAYLGTLQAGYTDFHYLRPGWQKMTEKEALLGVSMTGIATEPATNKELHYAARLVREENIRTATRIGINEAARTTCIKPEGTTSCVLGTSSGIHDWYDEYYIRRMGMKKNEPLYQYLADRHPYLLEDDFFDPEGSAHLMVPQAAPEGALFGQSALTLLNRVRHYSQHWIQPGHIEGVNSHNVSCTITIKEHEWDEVGKWMWDNRYSYNGIAVFPHSKTSHKHMPFESINKEKYEEMNSLLKNVDLSKVVEEVDITDVKDTVACGGGSCDIL